MAHPWMTYDEAIERLESWRAAAEEAAQADPDWLLDRAGGVLYRVTPFDQNEVFAHAADVVAFDLALAILRELAARHKPETSLIDGEWTPGGNQAIGI